MEERTTHPEAICGDGGRCLGDEYEVVGFINENCDFESDSEFEIFIAVPHETFPIHY